jgi:hypothetical protein
LAVTENHIIFTPNGPVPAGDLHEGHVVLVSVEDYALTDDQVQLLLGGTFGDGSIRRTGAHTAHFRVGHGPAQMEYLRWKHWMLEPFSSPIRPTGRGHGFDTLAMPALADLCGEFYEGDREGERRRTATISVLSRLDPKGLAVWYGDDGTIAGVRVRPCSTTRP